MPARGGGGGRGGNNDANDNQNQKGKFSAKLGSKADYEHWTTSLRNYSYGKGQAYYQMYNRGMTEDGAQDPAHNNAWHTDERREMWLALTNSFSEDMLRKHKRVELGDNETLIRAVKAEFDAKSETSLNRDMESLQNIKLATYSDLSAYFAANEELHTRLASHGDEEKVSESKKNFISTRDFPPITKLQKPR